MKPYEDRRFEFVRRLGSGGTAEVALVRVVSTGRLAALKYPLTSDPESLAQFGLLSQREHQLIGGLRHPGLVRILEVPSVDPPWLLLEYCPGPTLADVGSIQNSTHAGRLLAAIAAQLEALRFWGIVHGDLKPHNLFLPWSWQQQLDTDKPVITKLSDFSLGYRTDEPVTNRAGLGTIGYMAPETIANGECTHQSDLFALGVLAYQVVTGRHPFIGNETDPVRINARVCEEEPPSLVELCPQAGEGLHAVVKRLLVKDPAGRYQTAFEVFQDLTDARATASLKRIWRPGWLLGRTMNVEKVTSHITPRSPRDISFVRDRVGDQTECALALLDHNFQRGSLKYANGSFVVFDELSWPARLRKWTFHWFERADFTTRRRMVEVAIIYSAQINESNKNMDVDSANPVPSAFYPLLASMLRPVTIRRVSSRLAVSNVHDTVTTCGLWLLAGKLENALALVKPAVEELQSQNRVPDAITLIGRTLDLASVQLRTGQTMSAQMLRADLLKGIGNVIEAEQAYRRIIEHYEQHTPDRLLAETWKDLGDLYKMKRDYPAGIAALTKARDIYQSVGDELELSHTFNNLGNIYWVKGDWSNASREYRKALRIQRRLNVTPDIASTLSNLGGLACNRGRIPRSIALFELSLKLKQSLKLPGETARTLNNLGYAYYLSRNESKAIEVLAQALDINRQIGNRKEVLQNMENLAAVMLSAARLSDADVLLREALALAEELGDKPHCASLRLYAGTLFSRIGRFRDAAVLLNDGRHVLADINDPNTAAHIDAELARLRWMMGDGDTAWRLAKEVRRSAEAVQDGAAVLKALTLELQMAFDERQYEVARNVCRDLRAEREAQFVDALYLRFLVRTKRVSETEPLRQALLGSVLDSQDDIDLPARVLHFLEITGDVRDAEAALHRGLSLAEQAGLLPELSGLLAWRARRRQNAGDYELAFADYRKALELYREMVAQVDDPDDQQRFLAQPRVTELREGINSLASRLGKKDKAGTSPAFMQS